MSHLRNKVRRDATGDGLQRPREHGRQRQQLVGDMQAVVVVQRRQLRHLPEKVRHTRSVAFRVKGSQLTIRKLLMVLAGMIRCRGAEQCTLMLFAQARTGPLSLSYMLYPETTSIGHVPS